MPKRSVILRKEHTMDTHNSTSNVADQCSMIIDKYFHYYYLPVALVIIIAISLIERKATSPEQRRLCCGRRPGVPVPVNLLDGNENRLAHAAAFGCTTAEIVVSVFQMTLHVVLRTQNTFLGIDVPGYLMYAYLMFVALTVALRFYPLFLCLNWKCAFVHSTVGLLYSLMCLISSLIRSFQCIHSYAPVSGLYVVFETLLSIPNALCNFYLILRFTYMMFMDSKHAMKMCRNESNVKDNCGALLFRKEQEKVRLARSYHLQYVHSLFNEKQSTQTSDKDWKNKKYLRIITSAYEKESSFRYSPKVTATFFVAGICIYQVILTYILIGKLFELIFLKNITNVVSKYKLPVELVDQLHILYYTIRVSWYLGIGISALISLVYFFQLFYSYRKYLKSFYKGDFSKLPSSLVMNSPAKVLMLNAQYPGSQIAMLVFGVILQHAILFITFMLVAYLIILPLCGLVDDIFFKTLVNIISSFAFFLLFYVVQILLCKKLFLQKHEVSDGVTNKTEQVLALRNRELYHNMSFVLFFFYIILGIVRCVLRIIKAVVLGVLYFGRLDKCALMSGFEKWDVGHMAYISFLSMELVHCHPVLLVFCDLLLENQRERENRDRESNQSFSNDLYTSTADLAQTGPRELSSNKYSESQKTYNRRILNKWFKIQTLIKYPKLRKEKQI